MPLSESSPPSDSSGRSSADGTHTEHFDAELIRLARTAGDRDYDRVVGLIAQPAAYNPIHTRIWTGVRHPYRESVMYALALLESDQQSDRALAEEILLRVVAAQDVNESSSTYGIWSYYHEESLDQMAPPDWNWADFLGRDLALILFRHGARLAGSTRDGVRTALGHAARSIVRRNVAMSYSNIAAKGTFVTLAAGQLLDDQELTDYAVTRVGRLQDQIRSAGSFAEYNSAGYWTITVEAIAAITTYIEHPLARAGAGWILDRLWGHFAARWHSRTGQLTGPMARVYSDVPARGGAATGKLPGGDLLALVAKATNFAGDFGALPPIDPALGLLGVALVEVQAPAAIVARLLDTPIGQLRERFSYADLGDDDPSEVMVPVIGCTWQGVNATLGSVNLGEFWLQRRPLIGYWREADDPVWGPARYVKLQVVKDHDHSFSSALFSSVQSGSQVLWSIGFRSPGGDEHIGLHQIEAGQPFGVNSLQVIMEFVGLPDDTEIMIAGSVIDATTPFQFGDQLRIRTPAVDFVTTIDLARFGVRDPRLTCMVAAGRISIGVELLPEGEQQLTLLDVGTVAIAGTLSLFERGSAPAAVNRPSVRLDDRRVESTWTTIDGRELALGSPAVVGPHRDQLAGVRATIDGGPIPARGLILDA